MVDPRTQGPVLPLRYDEVCAQKSRCSLREELRGVSAQTDLLGDAGSQLTATVILIANPVVMSALTSANGGVTDDNFGTTNIESCIGSFWPRTWRPDKPMSDENLMVKG